MSAPATVMVRAPILRCLVFNADEDSCRGLIWGVNLDHWMRLDFHGLACTAKVKIFPHRALKPKADDGRNPTAITPHTIVDDAGIISVASDLRGFIGLCNIKFDGLLQS